MRVIHRSIDFYIIVKTRVRGAYYTQGRIIFEVLRYQSSAYYAALGSSNIIINFKRPVVGKATGRSGPGSKARSDIYLSSRGLYVRNAVGSFALSGSWICRSEFNSRSSLWIV